MHVPQPTFSIVIPTYQRLPQLTALLQAISQLDYPKAQFEVIVVDDGSETFPDSLIDQFRAKLDVQLLKQNHAGPAAARNYGAGKARNQFVAFTDDDCTPAPDWLHKLAKHLSDDGNHAIGGQIINGLPDNIYSSSSQLLIDYLYAYYNQNQDSPHFFSSNNLTFPTELFLKVGGFNTTFPIAAGEDRELCDRWVRTGYRLVYIPEVVVYHHHRLNLRTFWLQHFGYGKGAFYYRRVLAAKNYKPKPFEPLSFYWNLLCYPISNSHIKRSLFVSACMALSQAATVSGYLRQRFLGSKK
jgi:cellulose synthase/poly-beta-1,6-N-acetylglucosamine synthase-like glycosyltransferase